MFCLILVSVWQYAGYMMLIYVAGFMSVPESLKEAALIDGCNPGQALRKIILPLMRASFVQCLFLSITRCFVVYDVNLSLTNGDPFGSSELAAMHVYNTAFTYRNYGVGQAEALILFIVCAIIDAMAFWNDYLLPSLILTQKDLYTIPISTKVFYGTYSTDIGLVMAALLLAMLPILILYLFLQKFIVKGVTSGAVKG